jgi:hypothetical protein
MGTHVRLSTDDGARSGAYGHGTSPER